MTTCIDTNLCPEEKIMYDVVCNFYFGFTHYSCNSATTCTRSTGKYDCCSYSKNLFDCIVTTSSLQVPTIGPTVFNYDLSCDHICDNQQRIDTCYWYESIRFDTMCFENNNKFCCSQNRNDCCYTSTRDAIIVFGCITSILIALMFYFTVREQRKKIMSIQDINRIAMFDKYVVVV